MSAEMQLAQMLGSIPTTKMEKVASELNSMSLEELESLASQDGESFVDSAASEVLARERILMADSWGRELAQADFEKEAGLVSTVAGGLGKAIGSGRQAISKGVAGAKQMIGGAKAGIGNARQAFNRGLQAPARQAAAAEARAAGMKAAKQAPGDIHAARIQRRLAKSQAPTLAAPAAPARQPLAGPKGPLPGAPPGAPAPAASAPAAPAQGSQMVERAKALGQQGLARGKELAGQVGQWAKANPYLAAGGAAAAGLGAGAMIGGQRKAASVQRLEKALEKLSSKRG